MLLPAMGDDPGTRDGTCEVTPLLLVLLLPPDEGDVNEDEDNCC
jgi:hypothetical protein